MKHFLRIFSIFLAITFSLNASKSYGQTGVKISVNADTICPGTDIYLRIIDTSRPYPFVLPEYSYNGVNFFPLAQPDADHPIGLVTYDPTNDATVLNWRTNESNTTTLLKKVWYRVSYWLNIQQTGTAYRSNVVSLFVRPAASVRYIDITNGGQVVCINSAAQDLIPVSPIGSSFSWFKRAPGESAYSPILSNQNVTNPSLPSSAIPTNIVGTTYFKLRATYGIDCPADSTTTTVIIDPTSVAGTVSIASGTASICANTTAPTLTLTGNTGSILNWSSSGTISGTYNSLGGSITPTISNTQTAYYIATVKSGVCPSINTAPILVTVNQASNAGTITPVTQSICYNATPAAITLTGYLGTIQWQSSLTSSGGYSDIVGQTSATLPAGSISNTTTMYYQALVTNGVCPSATITATVNINPATVGGIASIASGTATICYNTTAPTITLEGSVGTVQWQSSSTSGSGFVDIAGTISPAVINTATKYYRAKLSSGVCTVAYSNEVLVTVSQTSNAGTISPVTQSICYNGTPASITLTSSLGTIQWQSSLTSSGGYSDIVGQTSATLPSASISNTTTMYYQAVVTNGVCPSSTITATVNVYPATVGGTASIASGTATICYNTTAPTIILAGSVGTIQWQSSSTSGSGFVDIAGTPSPAVINTATKYYRAKLSSGVCTVAYSNEVLVTVSQTSNAGTISPVTQTICYNATPAAITLSSSVGAIQWQSSLTAVGGYSDIAGQTSATLPSASISNTTTMYYQAVVTSGVCPSQTITATVNVNPTTVEGTTSITAGNASICYNTAAPTITLTGSVGTVQWLSSGTLTGTYTNVTGTSTSPNISNTSSAYYKASVRSGVCLTRETTPLLISVSPTSTTGSILPVTATICQNATPTAITLTGYTGTIQWQSTNIPGGTYSDMVGQTGATLPSSAIDNTATGYYKAVVTSGVCESRVINSTVNVTALSSAGTATITAGNATICSSTTGPTINLTGTVVGTVQWYERSIASATLVQNNTPGASAPIINQTTSKYYKALVTNGVCSAATSNEILVTVNLASNAGTITPVTQAICYNGTPAAITLSGYTGTIQWQSSTSPSGSYTNMVGLTSATLPSASISNTTSMYYQALVTSGVCPSQTITATVNVNPTSVGGTAAIASGTATICANTIAPVINLTGYTGIIQWQSSSTSGGGFTNITGTASPTINVTATKYYRALVTSGVCSALPSNEILITIDQISSTGSLNLSTQTICYNATPTALTLTNPVGTIQWQTSSTVGGTYTNMVGLTASTLPSASIDNTNTAFYKAVATNGVCPSATITATVNVDLATVAGTATGTATICANSPAPTITLSGNVGLVQWQSSLASGGSFTNITGTSSPTVNVTATRYYRALVTSGVCSALPSNEILVTVNLASSAGTITPSTQTICYSGTPAAISLTGSVGTIQWQTSSTVGGTYTNMVGLTASTLPSASIDNLNTAFYKAVVTNGVCAAATITATVNVDLATVTGTAAIASGTATICASTAAPVINLTGYTGTIQWQSSATTGGGFTNITGTSSPTVNVTATRYYRALVTSGVCSALPSNEILVTVDQASNTGTLTPVTQTICYNATPTSLTLTSPIGVIQWQTSSTAGGTYSNMTGLTASTLPSASINNTSTAFYKAVVTNGVCPSQTITATVNVNPTTVPGTATLSGTATICFGTIPGSLPSISLTGHTGLIQWQSSLASGGTYTNTGGSTSPIIDNGTSKYYRALVTSGVCAAAASNELFVSVDQPSVPGNISPSSQDICIGNSPTPISLTGYSGTIQWQSSTSNTAGTFTNMVGETTSGLLATAIDNNNTKYYQAVVKNGVCPAAPSLIATVNISQLPVAGTVNLTGNATVCYGTTGAGLPVITLSGATGTIQWQSSSTSGGVYTNTAGTTSPVIDNTGTKYYQAKVSSGPCASATSISIVVNVDPLSVQGSISNPTPRICQAAVPTALTLSGYVGTIQWQSASPGGTYSNMSGLTSATLPAGSINNNSTLIYKAVVTSGVCPSATVSSTVTVDPTSAAGTASLAGTSTVCYGTATVSLPVITLAGNVGTIQWQSATSIGGTYSNTSGTNSPVIDNTASKYYRAIVTSGVCNADNSNAILVSVDPTSQVSPIITAEKIQQWCIGSPATAVTLPGYTGTIIWQTATSLGGTYNTIGGQTTATLPSANIPTTAAGVLYYKAVVTSGVCPSINSDIVSVQTDAVTVAGTISSTSALICNNSAAPTVSLTGNTGSTIRWQSSTDGTTYNNFAPSQTTASINSVVNNAAPGALQVITYYKAIVQNGVCPNQTTNAITVSVDPTSKAGTILTAQKVQQLCIGSPATDVTLQTNVGTIIWKTATSIGGTYNTIGGQTAATLPSANMPTTAAGVLYYKAVVTSGVCPSNESDIVSVQTDALTVAGSISSTSALICNNSAAPTVSLTGNTGSTIRWQSSTDGTTYNNFAPSQTGTTINSVVNNAAPGISQVITYYKAIVQNGVCPNQTTNAITVSVDPSSKVGSISLAQKIQQWCIGSPATAVTLPTYTGTIIWKTATTLGGTYNTISGQTAATLPSANLPTNVAGTLYYRAVVTSGVCPSINSDIISVQTDAATVAGTIASSSNLICNGVTPPTITLTGNTGSTIQWRTRRASAVYVNPIPSQTGTSIKSVVNNAAPGAIQIVDYYQAIVKSGVCNSLTTNEVVVAIDPTSQVGLLDPLQKTQQVCIGSPATSVVLPSYVGTIQWQTATMGGAYSNMTGLTSATLPNTNMPTSAAGTLNYRAVVTSGVCPSINSEVASVQVDPATVAGTIASSSNLICNGVTPPTITLTGNTGSTIQWRTRRATAVYVNPIPSQTGTSINSVVNNAAPGAIQIVDYYQAIVKSGVCNSLTTNEVLVAIDPTSQVGLLDPLQKTQQVCIASPAKSVVLPNYVGTIQWQTATVGGVYGNMTGLTNATLPFGSIPTNVAGTLNYRAVVTSGVCPSINSEIVSVQTDAATVAGDIYYLKGSSPICNQGEKPTITIRNNTGSNIVWQITTISNSSSVIGTENSLAYANTTQTGNILNSAIDNNAPGAVSSFKYYRASVQNGVCKTEYTTALELEVIPTPVITKVVPAERCGPGIVELLAESNLGTPNWFAANTGGTAIGIGNSFTTPVLNTSTNYYVGALFRGCVSFSRTTVLAKIKPIPTITSVTGATNCGPGILELSATATGGEINWFTDPTGGSTLLTSPKYTTPLIRVTTIYYAQALQDGCYSAPRAPVEATIFEVPVIAALPDLYSICAGLTYNIKYSASLGLPPYVFNFFTNNSNVIGQKDGYLTGVKGGITNVYFNVKDMNGCVSLNTNSFQVKTYDPVSPQRFNYQAFYKDNFLIPTKIDSGYVSYNWQPGLYLNNPDKPNPIFNGENTTDYVLIRTDTTTKCTVADNYHIDVTRDFIFDLPNAFTPNYDGLNDVIKSIKNAGIDKVTSLSIFNRYGTKVCCTLSEIENGWNGTTNGKMQDTDGYFWRATFETKDGRTLTKKGAFLLLK